MDLSELYTTGTPLAEVAPHFRGMPLKEWLEKNACDQIRIQAAEWRERRDREKPDFRPPIADSRILTGKDLYGMKGLFGDR